MIATCSTIWWRKAEDLPDADQTVLVATSPVSSACSEPVWLGYWDGECWRDVVDDPIDVTHWAPLPEGPKDS